MQDADGAARSALAQAGEAGGAGPAQEGEAGAAPGSVRAMVRAKFADREGRHELRSLRAALRQGELSVKRSATAILSQVRDEKVDVILASSRPMRVDVRNTLAVRLGGDTLATALRQVLVSRQYRLISAIVRLLNCAVLFGCMFNESINDSIDGRVQLCLASLAMAHTVTHMMTLCVSQMFSMVIQRFDFWYICLHGALIVATVAVIVDDPVRSAATATWGASVPLALLVDCMAFTNGNLIKVFFLTVTLMSLACAMVIFYRLPFGMSQVNVMLFETTYSLNDRLVGSILVVNLYFARFAFIALRSPNSLVILTGLARARLPSVVVEDIFDAYSLQTREVGAALRSVREWPDIGNPDKAAVAPEPQSQPPPPPQQQQQEEQQEQEQLAPTLRRISALSVLEASGDEAAARAALLRVLDEELRDFGRAERRSSIVEQAAIAQRWAAAGKGEELEAVLLPLFVPLIVNRDTTIAAALGGPRLNELCRHVYGFSRFPAFVLIVRATASAIAVYSLTGRVAAWLVTALVALLGLAIALDAAYVLQLNISVLRSVVLNTFNIWWAMLNVFGAAVWGAFLFDDPRLSAVWVLWQLHTTGSFFQDAAPPSAAQRRLTGLSLVGLALLQLLAVFAIWARVFVVQEYTARVFGIPVGLLNVCVGAQLNVVLLAARYAVRILRDQSSLMITAGLAHAQVPSNVARNLRASIISLRRRAQVDSTGDHRRRSASWYTRESRGSITES
jgi:hypothetical protein